MKKALFSALVIVLAAIMLVSCGKAENSANPSKADLSKVSVDSLKTFGDIIDLNIEDKQTAAYEGYYIYAFNLNDTYYRAISAISKETFDRIINLDVTGGKYDEQLNKIVSPIKIEKMENLTENIPSQEELDTYIGKTCEELLDSGWSESGYNLDNQEFWMDHECYSYTVVFDGTVYEPADKADFDAYEDAKDLKVKSIKYNSIGDATYMEIEETEETEEAE